MSGKTRVHALKKYTHIRIYRWYFSHRGIIMVVLAMTAHTAIQLTVHWAQRSWDTIFRTFSMYRYLGCKEWQGSTLHLLYIMPLFLSAFLLSRPRELRTNSCVPFVGAILFICSVKILILSICVRMHAPTPHCFPLTLTRRFAYVTTHECVPLSAWACVAAAGSVAVCGPSSLLFVCL